MNKLFFTICFSLIFIFDCNAGVKEIIDRSQIPQKQIQTSAPQEPKEVSYDEMEDFLTERIEKAVIMDKDKVTTHTTHAQPSDTILLKKQENSKSTFRKIYENALKRLDKATQSASDFEPQKLLTQNATLKNKSVKLNFPTIKITLPTGNKQVMVPAEEHIPYFMSNIEILPGGSVKFTETIMVVANNNKLKNGLIRILPKYIVSRNNERKKINYTLVGVTANGQNIPYRLTGDVNNITIVPEQGYQLGAGIYTYKFEYLADNLLWNYNDFKEFYWDVSGSLWNMVITRSGATIALPEGVEILKQAALIGNANRTDKSQANIINPSNQNWGYASTRPLLPTESMHLILSLSNDKILNPYFSKTLLLHFNDYADVYVSLFTFLAITVSFILSWKYIKINKGQMKFSIKKSPVLIRFLAFNRYDIKSFGAFLLDIYRKNIIDIQQADDTVLLVKRTDNLKNLTHAEQKAVNHLFTQNEPVLNVNKNNKLKILRAAKVIERELQKNLIIFLLKLNSGYLFFSLCMMLCGICFISLMETNHLQVFSILCGGTLAIGFGIFIFSRQFGNIFLSVSTKAIGCAIIILAMICLAAIVSLWSILFILAGMLTIYYYTTAYAQRNGLLKKYIEDTATQKENILNQRDNILLGKEILSQQAYIWALDLEEKFITPNANEYNKLAALQAMIQNKLK